MGFRAARTWLKPRCTFCSARLYKPKGWRRPWSAWWEYFPRCSGRSVTAHEGRRLPSVWYVRVISMLCLQPRPRRHGDHAEDPKDGLGSEQGPCETAEHPLRAIEILNGCLGHAARTDAQLGQV